MSDGERDDEDDAAWLLACERGQPGPEVSAATAVRYGRLQALITDLPAMPAGVSLRTGWKHEVLAAIDAAEAAPDASSSPAPVGSPVGLIDSVRPPRTSTRQRRWAAAAAIFAGAAAAAILLLVYRGRGGATVPAIAFEVEPGGSPHRSSDPSTGDKLSVRGVVDGPGELRIYDGTGVEQARCTVPAPDCSVERTGSRTTLRLTMTLRVPGVLRAILFAALLDGPSGGLDVDLEAAARAGIAVTPLEPVEVY